MFKSIKTKIITTVIALFLIGISAITVSNNYQVKVKTQDSVIQSSEALVNGMSNAVENFFGQYGKGIEYLASTNTLRNEEAFNSSEMRDTMQQFLSIYSEAFSIYYALPNKEFTAYPSMKVGSDFDPTIRDWYKDATQSTDQVIWSQPYEDASSNELVVTASKAVLSNGIVVGVVGFDIKLSVLNDMIASNELGHEGIPYVLDSEGNVIVHPTLRGENVKERPDMKEVYTSESGEVRFTDSDTGIDRLNIFATIPGLDWKVGAVYEEKHINALASELRTSMLIVSAVMVIAIIIALYFIINRIVKPIRSIKDMMNTVSHGDLTVRTEIKTKDEIGDLGLHFNTMIDHTNAIITTVHESAKNVMMNSESLSAVAEETSASSTEVAFAVAEIAKGASKSAEDAELVSERAERLGSQIEKIIEKAAVMNDIARNTGAMNTEGRGRMNEMKSSFTNWQTDLQSMANVIGTLSEKVKAIGGVMETITEISAQTNLLALNASIEAARAGEHGKGFAVVAEEVRKLAEQSARSTDEVKATVQELQMESTIVTENMNTTIQNFNHQSSVVQETEMAFGTISSLMDDMQIAIEEVTGEIERVATYKDEVAQTIQTMAATSEETAAACEEVSASTDEQLHAIQSVANSAEILTKLSEELSAAVEHFKI